MTSSPPGVSVWPGARTNSVVPPAIVAVIGTLLTVNAGRPALNRSVCPLTTILEPWNPDGRLYVVPSTIIAPPGPSVLSPTTNTVVPPRILAVIDSPPKVTAGWPIMVTRVCVAPFQIAILPFGPSVSVLSSTTTMGPPFCNVCVPTTNCPWEFAVIVLCPTVRTGSGPCVT